MTTNKYATLRGTIARAKRNDCQKVVMRVTLVEELLLQLSNAEKQVAALAAENAGLKRVPATGSETMLLALDAFNTHGSTRPDVGLQQAINVVMQRREIPAADAFLAEVRANAIKSALNDCSECLDRDCIMDSNGISYEDAALREAGAMALQDALLRQERAV
ncbi:hypothetical protein [Enterobacter cloacae]|uniref:hypothetical protein n=1 Tax=Enterobacter cloacae TaxID=550 RepID=UPI00070A3B29|nr:hypothetical protein [Enterobacter cloacae]